MIKGSEKISKYMQIAGYFKSLILSGKIISGEQLLTENEIVGKFKVSRHTVRQALMELEKDGFIYKEQGKGTFCSFRNKSTKKRTIAVLTTYISNYIFPSIIRGIEEVLSEAGYNLMLLNTNNEKQKEAECLQKIIANEVVGLIVEPTMSAYENVNLNWYKELEKRNISYIMINAKYDELDPAYVVVDDIEGEYLLTKYLLQLGHTKIAGIFKRDDLQGVNRQLGYTKALEEFGIPINNELISRFETSGETFVPYEFTSHLIHNKERPTAIICYNDQIATYVLQAIRDAGLLIPEDISVTGYDDSDIAIATELKFTTVAHPKEDMGRRAARLLINMIEGRMEKPTYLYKPEIIVRYSTRNQPLK
ncbi:GntR family transcriptional regulator [Clostridium sp.]|uniref:GntR family transcriptional regulator n=1 Tax=Clostridium sp. TaxID=1506 RepID=UPI001A5F0174|nr:GntR family transcriptional regulator [Clostridium sp.]MBK5236565.1 GntR family transcriptional regulator [Clostridium sp.]